MAKITLPLQKATLFAGNDIELSWGAPSGGAHHYEREVSKNGGSWQDNRTYTGVTSVKLYNHAEGTYKYRIRACSSSGDCYSWKEAQTVTVSLAPPWVKAEPFGGNDVTLSWGVPQGGASYYEGAARKDGGNWGNPRTYTSTSTKLYNHVPGTYTYRVRACSSSGECYSWAESNSFTVN